MSDQEFVNQARVVVIGGGVVGCSILYHLARMGWKDVLLVEKADLTHGVTWHAAGLVGQLRSSRNVTRMIQYSVDLYRRLEQETGQPTGWNEVGSLRLASSEARMMELRKAANVGRGFGLDVQLIGPAEAQRHFPVMDLDGIVGGAWLASDGYADPSMLTHALAKGARDHGARIIRHNRVTGFTIRHGAVTHVHTEKGEIACDMVVNACGMWARRVGKMAGVNVPTTALEHQFMVTEPIAGIPRNLPVTRDPDHYIYYRGEVGGLIMGGFEPEPKAWKTDDVPWDFVSQLFDPDYDQFEVLSSRAIKRTPCLESAGIRRIVNGPDAYTPDGNFVLGLAPELKNFYVASGMNCFGIAGAGGVGKVMAEWIIEGEPSLDIYSLDIRRFGGRHNRSRSFVAARSWEYYSKHYTIAWPMYQNKKERALRRSPLYDALKAQNAVFGEKSGWERALWFAPQGVEPQETMTFGRGNWHEHVGREVRTIRENVAILDQTSFGKLEVRGPGALAALQRLATRDIDKPIGTLSYTQMCNARGGIECDLTIARIHENHFYIVTGTSFAPHDLNWIQRNSPDDGSVIAYDVTSSRGVLNLCGPNARKVLSACCEQDVSHEQFPFGTCRELFIGAAPVLALRVSYHGELGWELHIPTEFVAYVYDKLWQAGEPLGIVNVGYRALESCRLEKGYYYWSDDITTDYNPFEAGLGFNVSFKKGDFIGRDALQKIKSEGVRQKMCFFTLDEEVELFGSEPILRDGRVLGIVTSGGYGHSVGKTIAFGYLPIEDAQHDTYEIAAFTTPYRAVRHDRCVYDPDRARILS